MFDIIIKQGKKESFIKLNGNKLEGFTALSGNVFPLTEEEVNTINLLKLSDNKEYLGKDNEYDVYLDNNSGLKHYFKDGKEDTYATWIHNGEDALLYKGNNRKEQVKKIRLKSVVFIINLMIFGSILDLGLGSNFKSSSNMKEADDEILYDLTITVENDFSLKKEFVLKKEIIDTIPLEPLTVSTIENYIQENDKLTKEEKEIYNNEKLLQDVLPYYENTNMKVLIPLKFNGLHTKYFYERPSEEGAITNAYYNPLEFNSIFVNTCDVDLTRPNSLLNYDKESKDYHDRKAHEYIHLLQASYEYRYIVDASAEIISFEYDEECRNDVYLYPIKNTKILMEIVGPLPIWKLNFSADDTDLVNVIRANLSEEKADKLINLLKEIPNELDKENDLNITNLLSQMYTNMYGEDMRTNPFIDCLLNNVTINNRYYFNSNLIENKLPYTDYQTFDFWHAYTVSNTQVIDVLNDFHNEASEELYILFKNDVEVTNISELTEDFLKEKEVKFYFHGKEISFDNVDLEKYKNVPVTYQGYVPLEGNVVNYYPTIYESFPDQKVGAKEFFK